METRGPIKVSTDAEGIMVSMVRLRSTSPAINNLAKELALFLAPLGHSLSGIHLWSEENSWCDQLSRLAQGEAIPRQLRGVPRTDVWPRAAN
eukprot:9558943-Heterocapsa_arctica.AAC.1